MKAFICFALIVICNVVVNQAATFNIQAEYPSQFEPDSVDGVVNDEYSRQKRAADNGKGQASVDVQKERGRTSVNAQVGKVWESNNGRTTVEANANWGRDFGRGGSKPNYGANVGIRHRF